MNPDVKKMAQEILMVIEKFNPKTNQNITIKYNIMGLNTVEIDEIDEKCETTIEVGAIKLDTK